MKKRIYKNQVCKTLKVESIGFEGISIAREDGMVYFVKGGVPGDIVNAKILKKRKSYTEAMIENIIEPSKDRIEPKCRHFEYCGGCSWQNLSYDNQILWKKKHVEDAVRRIGGLDDVIIHDTIASPREFNYRNKMDFTFGAARWLMPHEIISDDEIEDKSFAFGMHVRGRYDKVLDIFACDIQPDEGNLIISLVREIAAELDVTAYHIVNKVGFLRNLVIRKSKYEDSLMLILITTSPKNQNELRFLEVFKDKIFSKIPNIKSILLAINDSISPVANGEFEILQGEDSLLEKILDVTFKISPFSFFQTNSYQLDNFIGKIIEFAELKGYETVWDLYCGTGSITLPMAKKCSEIYGIELVESSINDAKKNAVFNEIDNVKFICEDLHSVKIPDVLNQLPKPDVLVVDPPRAGLHKNLIAHIIEIKPERIIYVSCNPATQARDFEILKELYHIVEVQPFDMFPQTYHIESIAKLILKDNG